MNERFQKDGQFSGVSEAPQTDCHHTETEEPRSKAAVAVLEWLEMFVSCFSVVLLIVTFVVRQSPVIGSSMTNTLHEKDVVIVNELFYKPRQGDVIVAQSVPLGYDETIVKRVIATGGQTVDIDFDTWTVYVDGEALDEPYVLYRSGVSMHEADISFPLDVPEGYIFVMGDNRNGSMDSRDSRVGLIDERMVVGHVILRILPLSSFGVIS